MKLELKHLAPYLPYGLKLYYTHTKKIGQISNIYTIGEGYDNDDIKISIDYTDGEHIWMFKPILRPLSDLTKHEYWSELLILMINRGFYKSRYASDHNDYEARIIKKPFGKIFKLQNHDDWVLIISLNQPDRCKAFVYGWLLENHFDVFGLIEKGLAIDINTLNK